jgi:hypothetical protein
MVKTMGTTEVLRKYHVERFSTSASRGLAWVQDKKTGINGSLEFVDMVAKGEDVLRRHYFSFRPIGRDY